MISVLSKLINVLTLLLGIMIVSIPIFFKVNDILLKYNGASSIYWNGCVDGAIQAALRYHHPVDSIVDDYCNPRKDKIKNEGHL